jgi:hypothetical protein
LHEGKFAGAIDGDIEIQLGTSINAERRFVVLVSAPAWLSLSA